MKSLERQYLSKTDIEAQSKKGNISLESIKAGEAPLIDIHQEVKCALKAFEQQRFFITINGYQPETLNEKITLIDNSNVLFLRLMPLVGG